MRDANKRVAETSQATAEIAREIVGVDQAAGQMAEGSEQVKASADRAVQGGRTTADHRAAVQGLRPARKLCLRQ